MAIIFIRTVILYFAILVSMRVMGKRQLGELEISEFIVAALIADLAATPLQDIGIPLLNGLLPIMIMFCLEIIIAGLNMKSVRLRKFTYGKPEIIIRNGRIDRGSMRRNRFTIDELMQELQSALEREVSTVEIGEMVMKRIKLVDEVAYVRFASVYRSFKDINTFMEELTKLLSDK